MNKSVSNCKFQAEPSDREYQKIKKQAYEWVPKYQIIAAFIVVFQCMYFASITEGWKVYLSNFIAIAVLYFMVSGIFERIKLYIDGHDKEINNLRRQLTGFICDSALDKVSQADLKRIGKAANDLALRTNQGDLSKDDFNLLSRAWFFWINQNGFDWQDNTKCINCDQERKAHLIDGTCPA